MIVALWNEAFRVYDTLSPGPRARGYFGCLQIHTGAKVPCRAGGNQARLGARVHVPVAILDQEFIADTIGRLGTVQVKATVHTPQRAVPAGRSGVSQSVWRFLG